MQSTVFPARVVNFQSKKPKVGRAAGMEFGNVWTEHEEAPLPDFSIRRNRKLFLSRVNDLRAAVGGERISRLGATLQLRKHYDLSLSLALLIVDGEIDFPTHAQ